MSRPERGAGFKAGGLVYDYLSGWTDYDQLWIRTLIDIFERRERYQVNDNDARLAMWVAIGRREPGT